MPLARYLRFSLVDAAMALQSTRAKRTAQESFEPEVFVWRRSMSGCLGQPGGKLNLSALGL